MDRRTDRHTHSSEVLDGDSVLDSTLTIPTFFMTTFPLLLEQRSAVDILDPDTDPLFMQPKKFERSASPRESRPTSDSQSQSPCSGIEDEYKAGSDERQIEWPLSLRLVEQNTGSSVNSCNNAILGEVKLVPEHDEPAVYTARRNRERSQF